MAPGKRTPNYDNRRSQARMEQEQGDINLEAVAAAIRAAIHTAGRPFAFDDPVPCYPKEKLPSFVRMEVKAQENPLGRTSIYNNIEDLCADHSAAPFVLAYDSAGVAVIFERPHMRTEDPPKSSRSARRTT